MTAPLRFNQDVAIITGAAGGLGEAHAMELAVRGARVMLLDLNPEVEAVADRIRAEGGQALARTGSVASLDDCHGAVTAAVTAWGRLDIVVNNAGLLRDHTLEKQTDAEWDLVLDVHLTGARNLTVAAWPELSARGYGRIVNTTSGSGLYGNFGQSNYSAAKMGIVGFTRTCALEGARRGITVNAIAPIAHTPMTDTLWTDSAKTGTSPSLVSPLVAYLVSRDHSGTGQIFACGGGYVARVAVIEAEGARVAPGQTLDAEWIAANIDRIGDLSTYSEPASVLIALERAFTA